MCINTLLHHPPAQLPYSTTFQSNMYPTVVDATPLGINTPCTALYQHSWHVVDAVVPTRIAPSSRHRTHPPPSCAAARRCRAGDQAVARRRPAGLSSLAGGPRALGRSPGAGGGAWRVVRRARRDIASGHNLGLAAMRSARLRPPGPACGARSRQRGPARPARSRTRRH